MTTETTKAITTRKHANYLLGKAQTRLAAAVAAVATEEANISTYAALAVSLPEGPAGSAPKVPAAVGDRVEFGYGRGEGRTTLVGDIVAAKQDESGAVTQFLVAVGTGFDAQNIKVFPGQITVNQSAVATSDDPLAEPTY